MHYHVRTLLFVVFCGGVIALWAWDIHRRTPPQQVAVAEPGLLSIPEGAQNIRSVSGETVPPPATGGSDPAAKTAPPKEGQTVKKKKAETAPSEMLAEPKKTTAAAPAKKTVTPPSKKTATPTPPPPTAKPVKQPESYPALPKPDISLGAASKPSAIDGRVLLNKLTFNASITTTDEYKGARIAFVLNQNTTPSFATMVKTDKNNGPTTWSARITAAYASDQRVYAVVLKDGVEKVRSQATLVRIRTSGPSVQGVQPQNLAFSADHKTISVRFNAENPLDVNGVDSGGKATFASAFTLKTSKSEVIKAPTVEFNPAENLATLKFEKDLAPDNYTLTVNNQNIQDAFGNKMATPYQATLFMPVGGDVPTVSRGISGATGRNVEFSEYTPPRKILSGFNPSDRVETRVSRLYYYRDAHRVAQIINRDVKSYNRAAVDMQQQLADKSRTIADQATDDRRGKERKAVEAAKKTREAEREQEQAEQQAQRASQLAFEAARQTPAAQPGEQTEDDKNRARQVKQFQDVADASRAKAKAAREKVEALREEEVAANEAAQVATAVEDRARDDQFRREVAAANADPDTYAPGKPDSQDPVQQVSVSVIGEGLIQLRGPMKGINVIRTMINQMDAPVGQVRISVHTVQINGEKGDRMEKVASKIQRFIDHSRFLTLQSAEMFRKSIVQVAARKAIELNSTPGLTQHDRDQKYLHAFFGQDFIHELQVMDSEFLHTGNKLLSIHSMDSTSLASAMFIMALAKNSTRMEILQTFEGMMQHQLPIAEQNYFEAGYTSDGKRKLFSRDCRPEDFQLLSANARFQSIRGMFDVEITADDTMTPFQRDFLRLAQIFKSRLIVEMELRQRVMERSVIEERLSDDPVEEARLARQKEKLAKLKAEEIEEKVTEQLSSLRFTSQRVRSHIGTLHDEAVLGAEIAAGFQLSDEILKQLTAFAMDGANSVLDEEKGKRLSAIANKGISDVTADICLDDDLSITKRIWKYKTSVIDGLFNMLLDEPPESEQNDPDGFGLQTRTELIKELGPIFKELKEDAFELKLPANVFGVPVTMNIVDEDTLVMTDHDRTLVAKRISEGLTSAEDLRRAISKFQFTPRNASKLQLADACLKQVEEKPGEELNDIFRLEEVLSVYAKLAEEVEAESQILMQRFTSILASLADQRDLEQVYADWVGLHNDFKTDFTEEFLKDTRINEMDSVFTTLIRANIGRRASEENVERSRRPLDHKKFLDMLIDEMEDKYIELLEGTRAHTANIDAYIKRLMTSLDDDFNTQFYYPTFRKVREASQMWDVQMGQVETTNVLANNRAFAKVTPEATMEFDLPKRDILIAEAMNGAKAMVQDFGALAQDPTFLSMAKMGSGAPTSTQTGGANGGQSTVRNVLPAGLSTSTAETVMGQQGPGGNQFGSALESLIPDPAIYKFETGTGWEIRPVIQPDGQSVVFDFNYLYTANVREPVRADEKHLGRVKRHQVSTDVQLSNFELREISRYVVALKASRTSRGVPLLEDIPGLGVLFRPQPSQESSLQQNVILGQSTIFPTLFDLMGLRWAPVVADLDPLRLSNDEFIVRSRRRALMNRVFDQSSSQVDQFLRIPEGERRMDLYRSQETIPAQHPNGYRGPGASLRDSQLREGYDVRERPETQFVPSQSPEGSQYLRQRDSGPTPADTRRGRLIEGPPLDGPVLERPGRLVPRVRVQPPRETYEDVAPPPPDMSSRSNPRRPGRIAPVGYFVPVRGAPNQQTNTRPVGRPLQAQPIPPGATMRRLPPVEPRRFPLPD